MYQEVAVSLPVGGRNAVPSIEVAVHLQGAVIVTISLVEVIVLLKGRSVTLLILQPAAMACGFFFCVVKKASISGKYFLTELWDHYLSSSVCRGACGFADQLAACRGLVVPEELALRVLKAPYTALPARRLEAVVELQLLGDHLLHDLVVERGANACSC